MATHKTVFDSDFEIKENYFNYNYQSELTKQLDQHLAAFDQNTINEIVLWKVNRYAKIDDKTLDLINGIDSNAIVIDLELTKKILQKLLETNGIRLPMASTILRFRNRNIYQIIDQRVYRLINKEQTLKTLHYVNDTNINAQIELYLQYLNDLKVICEKLKIPFHNADRILYEADKDVNAKHKIDNY